MRPKTNRLLMLLMSTMLGACAGQTERSSSGSATGQPPKTLAYEPAPYVEPPPRGAEPATAPPKPSAPPPKAAAAPAPEPVPEFVAEAEPSDMVPVPSADSFEPDADDRKISEPVMAHDEEELPVPEEGITAQSQYFEEEERPAQDEDAGIVGQSQYHEEEEEGVAKDDGIVAQNQYYDEESIERDDGIVAQNQYYDEETVETDDGIVARNQYYDEEVIEADDGIIARNQYYDEEIIETEDGIVARNQYYDDDEEVVTETDDGIVAHNQYYDEEVTDTEDGIVAHSEYFEEEGKEPAELIGEPKSYPEESVVAAAEEKQPAVEEKQPAPKPEPPKPVVLPVTVTFETEALFDFDRYAVRPDGRDKLDKLASGMQGVAYDTILVVGHADRIGTTAYNQRLSERRAEAVKKYLVSKGLLADKIKTEGRGELDPAQDPSACKGLRKQKLIACLQPDRRVDVTVSGQKQPK